MDGMPASSPCQPGDLPGESLLQHALDQTLAHLASSMGALFLVDEKGEDPKLLCQRGLSSPGLACLRDALRQQQDRLTACQDPFVTTTGLPKDGDSSWWSMEGVGGLLVVPLWDESHLGGLC